MATAINPTANANYAVVWFASSAQLYFVDEFFQLTGPAVMRASSAKKIGSTQIFRAEIAFSRFIKCNFKGALVHYATSAGSKV